MSSTTVRSENNQIKTEVTGMGIVFNTRENKYEIEVGQTLDTVLKESYSNTRRNGNWC